MRKLSGYGARGQVYAWGGNNMYTTPIVQIHSSNINNLHNRMLRINTSWNLLYWKQLQLANRASEASVGELDARAKRAS